MDPAAYLQARQEQLQRALELHNVLAATANAMMAKPDRTLQEEAKLERVLEEGSAVDFIVESISEELGVKLHLAQPPDRAN